MVFVIIILGIFIRGGEIEDLELKKHNKQVNDIDFEYNKCQFGLEDKYKDSTFHPPQK